MITKVVLNAYDVDYGIAVELQLYTDTEGCKTMTIGYEDGVVDDPSFYYDMWIFAAAIATNSGLTLQGELKVHLTKSACEKLQEEVNEWNEWYKTDIKINNESEEEEDE